MKGGWFPEFGSTSKCLQSRESAPSKLIWSLN